MHLLYCKFKIFSFSLALFLWFGWVINFSYTQFSTWSVVIVVYLLYKIICANFLNYNPTVEKYLLNNCLVYSFLWYRIGVFNIFNKNVIFNICSSGSKKITLVKKSKCILTDCSIILESWNLKKNNQLNEK